MSNGETPEEIQIREYRERIAAIKDPIERRTKDCDFRIWIRRLKKNPNRRPMEATHEIVRVEVPIKDANGKEKKRTLQVIVSKNKEKHVPQPSQLSGPSGSHTEQIHQGSTERGESAHNEHRQ